MHVSDTLMIRPLRRPRHLTISRFPKSGGLGPVAGAPRRGHSRGVFSPTSVGPSSNLLELATLPLESFWLNVCNAICLGVAGKHRWHVFFWDNEDESDPDEWDGEVETAGNVTLHANSFADFVAGLRATGGKWLGPRSS